MQTYIHTRVFRGFQIKKRIEMIEWIHLVLGARVKKRRLVRTEHTSPGSGVDCGTKAALRSSFLVYCASYPFSALEGICSLSAACADVFEDTLRFAFILFRVIPSLAFTFVVLSIGFHIYRIVATYACRPIAHICRRHVRKDFQV